MTRTWPAQQLIGHFIGGHLVADSRSRTGEVFNPATGRRTHSVALASADETRVAIAAARDALPGWEALSPLKHTRVLLKFIDLVRENAGPLAHAITAEHGKILADAHAEIMRGIEVAEFACGIPHLLKGEFSGNVGPGIDSWSMRQAVGAASTAARWRASAHRVIAARRRALRARCQPQRRDLSRISLVLQL